jgi:hypothetical protein
MLADSCARSWYGAILHSHYTLHTCTNLALEPDSVPRAVRRPDTAVGGHDGRGQNARREGELVADGVVRGMS